MIERKVVLKNRTGLHARPASELVAFAKELPCKVYLEHNGKKPRQTASCSFLRWGQRRAVSLCFLRMAKGISILWKKLEAFLAILEG